MYISRPVAGLCLPFYTYFDCNCPAPPCQASGVFSIGCAVLFFKFFLLSGFCFVSRAIFVLFFCFFSLCSPIYFPASANLHKTLPQNGQPAHKRAKFLCNILTE